MSWLRIPLVTIGFCGLTLGGATVASEWTFWRGPAGDGVSGETGLISSWSPEGENLVWKAEFTGRSTPVVVDGRVCASGRVGEGIDRQEVVACFDANTGARRWEHRFNVYNTTVPFNRVGWASLAADPQTGYVYAHGVAGQLNCYGPDGRIVWSRFLTEDVGRLSGYGGRTQTPLVLDDQLILSFVNSGWGKHAAPRHRYFSFDKATGAIRWIATPGNMPFDMNTQSGPVPAEIGGRRVLVSGNADGYIYALDAQTGEKIWGFQLSRRGVNSNVLVHGTTVFASHSEENIDDAMMGRVVAIDGTGKGDVTRTHELWRINELAAGFPSPALLDGRLYVVDNSANLHSIDAGTGEVKWMHSIGTVGKGSPVLADGKLYVTEVNGRFHIIEPGRDAARTLDTDELKSDADRYAEIYGSPAIAGGRIYFTTEGGIYCLGRKDQTPPKPPASRKPGKTPVGAGAPASIRVMPTDALILPERALRFEVRAFDSKGRQVKPSGVEWSLAGLKGEIDAKGNFVPDTHHPFQAGMVRAKVGGLESGARLRVVPDLPWFDDFESYASGKVPTHWIGASKKYEVQDHDGNKVLVKLYREKGLLRNALYMGPSTLNNYTIEADVMGAQKGRRRTDVGLIANGYTFDLMGNAQRVQVRTWPSEERIAREIDFPWEMGAWYHMKLRVDAREDKALIRGKVWKKTDPEPEGWTITVEDPFPIAAGSPGLVGYSPADVMYDNIKVMVN